MTMLRRRFLAAIPAFVLVDSALVEAGGEGKTADRRFPPSIVVAVDGSEVRLSLTGSAMRKKYGFSVYEIASYVKEGAKVRDADGLAKAEVVKQLQLVFEREVDGATMAASFRGSIGANYPAPAFSDELAKLERYFLDHAARKGDRVCLTAIPGVGLGCRVVGQPGVVIEGPAFARAAWDAYLGPNNVGVAIKDGLTSRLR